MVYHGTVNTNYYANRKNVNFQLPAALDPMLKRPLFRMFTATLKPSPTSPKTFSAGTGVFSKLTSKRKLQSLKTKILL